MKYFSLDIRLNFLSMANLTKLFIDKFGLDANIIEIGNDVFEQIKNEASKIKFKGHDDKYIENVREVYSVFTHKECVNYHKTYVVNIYADLVNEYTKERIICRLLKLPVQIGSRVHFSTIEDIIKKRAGIVNRLDTVLKDRDLAIIKTEIYNISAKYPIFYAASHKNDFPADKLFIDDDNIYRIASRVKTYFEEILSDAMREKECPYDYRTYFVVGGMEKLIVTQEQPDRGRIVVTQKNDNIIAKQSGLKGLIFIDKHNVIKCVINKKEPGKWNILQLFMFLAKIDYDNRLPYSEPEYALSHIRKFLIPNDKYLLDQEIYLQETYKNYCMPNEQEHQKLESVAKKLDEIFSPGIVNRYEQMCIMVAVIIDTHLGARNVVSKDNIKDKYCLTAGNLLKLYFDREWNNVKDTIPTDFMKIYKPVWSYIKPDLRNKKWNIFGKEYAGVAQDVKRVSYIDSVSYIRRIDVPREEHVGNYNMRAYYPEQAGFVCACDTPDSTSVGIVKSLSIFAVLTRDLVERNDIISFLNRFIRFEENTHQEYVKIFLNNVYIGCTKDKNMSDLQLKWADIRRKTSKLLYTSFSYDQKDMEIRICSTAGRFTRLLINLKQLREKHMPQSIDHGISEGVFEFLDAAEIQNYNIASRIDKTISFNKTHAELSPIFPFGYAATLIPFANRNHSARNTFQCGMSKQALVNNANILIDNTIKSAKVLFHAQKPLCTTTTFDTTIENYNGVNVTIAVLTGGIGCNQEDSLVFNKRSIDLGLFLNARYDREDILLDSKSSFLNFTDDVYKNGILRPGSCIEPGTVIARIKKGSSVKDYKTTINKRTVLQKIEIVYSNRVPKKNDGTYTTTIVRLTYASVSFPRVGDKFSSRYAQKGVIGSIVDYSDMPYDDDGNVPDVLINPHAFPSRMTIGHIIETILSVRAIHNGAYQNANAFDNFANIIDESMCLYTLYDPKTGIATRNKVFVGMCYYQCLKHQIKEKSFSTGHTSRQITSGQPMSGISKYGALRIGEMEKDALIAYGVACIISELLRRSDEAEMRSCIKCGNVTTNDTLNKCPYCDNDGNYLVSTEVNSSFHVMMHMLTGMNIHTYVGLSGPKRNGLPIPSNIQNIAQAV